MSTPANNPGPSPELFFQTITAYQQSAALRGAIDLDLFTAIADGHLTAEAIAQQCKADTRGMRILCDFLVVHGFLLKEGSQYRLTEDSAIFLNRHSPACVNSTARFLMAPMLIAQFQDVAGAVRKGGSVSEAPNVEPEHPIWMDFARAMEPMMALPSQFILNLLGEDQGQEWKVLDIAASHGLFGINLLKKFRKATVVAVDWKNVLTVAKENAAQAGVSDRHTLLAGSAFDVEFGKDYDVVLITNFLHHFDRATCEQFFKKVHECLKPGGRAITLEFSPNEDRVTPPLPASFSLVMLATTPGGDAYTFREYDQMAKKAGFRKSEFHQATPSPEQVIVSYK